MELKHRSYNSKIFRPKPLIHSDSQLLVVMTPWGSHEVTEKSMQDIVKYIESAVSDVEVTSPFEHLTCLSDEANYLRIALMIANESVYRSFNRSEFAGGFEILIMLRNRKQMTWAKVGSPHLLIQREKQALQAVSISSDLTFELSHTPQNLSPLPGRILGLDPTCHIECGDILLHPEDKLVLISASYLPIALWTQSTKNISVDSLTQIISKENSDSPFWLGLLAP